MSLRPRKLATIGIGAVTAGVLAASAVMATAACGEESAAAGLHAPPPAPAVGVPWGAFLGSGAEGVKQMAEMQDWLGGTALQVGHTYLPGSDWKDIEGDPRQLKAWADWRRADEDRLFVLNVPMLDHNESGAPDDEVRYLLRDGAAGWFDDHFRTLAGRLVDLGVPDTVIVLGWEMNGTTYTGRCAPDPQAWKAYWRRIVTTMRSVPGQSFRFDFAPNRGRDAIGWTECYPGDDVVDIIGMDSYDQPPGHSFDEQVKQPFGLQDQVDFAAAHNKAISYPEWGLFRNGDNPEYMRRMLGWIKKHRPEYHTLTDYCPHGVWQCDENPKAARVFRTVQFTPHGAEPEPERTADCLPLNPGRWFESIIGKRRLCFRFDWPAD